MLLHTTSLPYLEQPSWPYYSSPHIATIPIHAPPAPQPVVVQRMVAPPTFYREVPLVREIVREVPVYRYVVRPRRPTRRPPLVASGSGAARRVAGGWKVLDQYNENARDDLFYGRFSPSSNRSSLSLSRDASAPVLLRRPLSASSLSRPATLSRIQRLSSSPSAQSLAHSLSSASLVSSHEDLTAPNAWPGTEFGYET